MSTEASGRLVAVSVGLPQDITWDGRTVRTAIWKTPVDGPRMVRRLNIDGDDQGDRQAHGGEHRAVFVYQLDSYRYWAEQLGREDLTHGNFGENFTVDGLADDEVHIGDRFRIGGAELEVTQPRVTCYRVGIRMNQPDMPQLLVAHKRPGFYLRVLVEGEVQAGDHIEQIAAGPEQMTVADVDALLYLPGRRRRDLTRAQRIPALSSGWRQSFRELLTQADATPPPPAWPGFRPLRVTAVERESETITSFYLSDDDRHAAPAQPGQYLSVRLRPDPDGPPLIRSYSLSTAAGDGTYRISVKRDGAASRHLHDAIAAGATLDAAAPRGDFTLDAQRERPVVLISAGVGATPVLAMLHALAADAMPAPVWWIHTARDQHQQAFAREVDELLARLPDAHRVVCLTTPAPDTPHGESDLTGRLTAARLADLGLPLGGDYYLCGPTAFMDDVSAALVARGVPPERVRSERFGTIDVTASGVIQGDRPPPHPPAGAPGTGPLVSFVRSGLNVAWSDDHTSLLELAEACDVPVDFGCRTGVCHACRTTTLSGTPRYRTEPLERPAAGDVLMCCAVPDGEIVLDL
jgi:ferredoxin-NADP reductase/MOSC domain-containing protein YiiM